MRKILEVYWTEKISNINLRKRAQMDKIRVLVKVRRWNWIRLLLREDTSNNCRIVLISTPEGRKRGRTRETWKGTVEKECY